MLVRPFALLSMLLLAGFGTSPAHAEAGLATSMAAPGHVRINQLGFAPHASKLAVVERADAAGFRVVREDDGEVVLHGTTGPSAEWAPAGRIVTVADFSELRAPGRYRIEVDGLPPSDPFPIRDEAYAGLADAALKAFYFNRAGTVLPAEHAGPWARAAGHPDTKV